MFKTGLKGSFRARHRLIGEFGDETIPHEHTYEIEWICSVDELDENGFGVDIDLLSKKLNKLIRMIDGAFLNELDFFKNRQPSVENSALFFAKTLLKELADDGFPVSTIRQTEVKIWESETAWASYIQNSS